ncbi:hypothetical protein TCAL_02184 [Tigriopus californicus]|uniref:GTP-binding protein Di-Ras2 n=1 Tax=Tigriopus californicus TaxID=6832 RepID=A0A553NVD2_TIGCA|nr:uncharacterized protein LOC131893137 isoform X2 [Tigriopus californicus]TRY69394.1 hypothetical protein TCAL_02184 [Tigriopus californicus]
MKADFAMSDRLRLVVMGDGYVGKSALIKRFLFGTFPHKYVPTVEDLFSQDYELDGTSLKVDILDTAGDAQFPAMRRLSISSAHAFLLVYSLTDPTSFAGVRQRFEEIKEQRSDYQDIPIVVVGNKTDLVREVDSQDVMAWMKSDLPKLRTDFLEASACTDDNGKIRQLFKTFLILAKIHFGPRLGMQDDGNVGLRRNLSAYGRLKSPMKSCKSITAALTPNSNHSSSSSLFSSSNGNAGSSSRPMLISKKGSTESNVGSPCTPKTERKFLGLSLSPFGSPCSQQIPAGTFQNSSLEALEDQFQRHLSVGGSNTNGSISGGGDFFAPKSRNSKRSRSLIRRSSKKVKQQVNNVHNPEDCVVS